MPRRRHRQADLGEALQRLPQRRARRTASAGRRRASTPRRATSTRSASAGTCIALDAAGKLLWERSLTEEFGAITTHGGRTVSPVIEGDLVIVSTLTSGWGDQARGGNRYFAFDKKTGDDRLGQHAAAEALRHQLLDARSSVDGQRHAAAHRGRQRRHRSTRSKPRPASRSGTLEISKRAILHERRSYRGTTAYVTHSEENLDTSEMGLIGALDATRPGKLEPEQARVADVRLPGRLRLAGDSTASGSTRWTTARSWPRSSSRPARSSGSTTLGTIQKASPVLADGKLYVGHRERQVLHPEAGRDRRRGPRRGPARHAKRRRRRSSPRRPSRDGRVYLVSMDALYAIGPKASAAGRRRKPRRRSRPHDGARRRAGASLQVVPYELVVKPGETVAASRAALRREGPLRARGAGARRWSLERPEGPAATGRRAHRWPADGGAQARPGQGDGRRAQRDRRACA